MTKRYWLILISFIIMQLATSVTAALLVFFGFSGTFDELIGTTVLITFTLGFFVILFLTLKTEPDLEFSRDKASGSETVLWSILGIFMAFGAQILANFINIYVLGIEPGSENTQDIVGWANAVPLMMIVVAIFVPIMEEIVFRMVIFGSLFKRYGFWIAALLSGLIFAVVHMDFKNLIVYLAMGIVFAFLYVKTKRIIVPIMAHVGINSFVMIVQVVFGEDIQRLIDEMDNIQAIIGGLFL
ncbi:lysostaphin resistance A-like protein [Evansella sp. AB-rgal1]|uniref:CPBP family intramembrane glutamic endopeptidase n=1 Tax=Evansella sp. AB-rgal1 TaxID=3242696 RepID=UPI00359CC6F2